MRRSTSIAAAGLAAALVLTLAGCFSSAPAPPITEESAPPAISVEPASGALVTGTGYSFNIPDDGTWDVAPMGPPQLDVVVVRDAHDDGFSDSFNVVLWPDAEVTADEFETDGSAKLESVDATDVRVNPRVAIAGAESVHLSALLAESEGVRRWFDWFYVSNAGQPYVISFLFSETVPQEDRDVVTGSVLASWTWAD
jgi:hypothetical protein